MGIEYWIGCCRAESGQIKNYDPDPYYVSHFFQSYLEAASKAYDGIFEEANRDFGMFVPECSMEKFREKSILKGDAAAAEFVVWYEKKMEGEHQSHYAAFMQKIVTFYELHKRLPDIRIMLRAKDRYKDDTFQEVFPNLSGGKLQSREELQTVVNRQIPIFLEVINHKRDDAGEPRVSSGGVVASAFFDGFDGFEIGYVASIYIQVIERMVSDSRRKIIELTAFRSGRA